MDYKIFLDGVRKYNHLNNFQEDYISFILEPRVVWENLNTITVGTVKNTVIEFLRRWKIRNTQRIDREELRDKLHEVGKYSKLVQGKKLLNLDFIEKVGKKDVNAIIKKMYDKITEVYGVGPTSTSKILHGINPSLFMMWDKEERLGYGCAGNSVGYIRFLFESQIILTRILKSYQEEFDCDLQRAEEEIIKQATTRMSLVKLLDQYNFMKFTKKSDLPDPHNEIFHVCYKI